MARRIMKTNSHAERMFNVVAYIENNLDGDISTSTLANVACYSEYHFHRLFRAFVGESVHAYKKRLLLERSVRRLQYSQDSIADIAASCGYETQSSFNKAFKQQFGLAPSKVRQGKAVANPLTLSVAVGEEVGMHMKPEMVTINDIDVIYARETGQYADAAAKAWPRIMRFAYSNRLMSAAVRIIGISHDDPTVTEAERIRYDACLDITADADLLSAHALGKQTILGGLYAKFIHAGPYENFPETFQFIFNDWLPESGMSLRDEPCFEIYLNRNPRKTKPENLKTEIYVPVA